MNLQDSIEQIVASERMAAELNRCLSSYSEHPFLAEMKQEARQVLTKRLSKHPLSPEEFWNQFDSARETGCHPFVCRFNENILDAAKTLIRKRIEAIVTSPRMEEAISINLRRYARHPNLADMVQESRLSLIRNLSENPVSPDEFWNQIDAKGPGSNATHLVARRLVGIIRDAAKTIVRKLPKEQSNLDASCNLPHEDINKPLGPESPAIAENHAANGRECLPIDAKMIQATEVTDAVQKAINKERIAELFAMIDKLPPKDRTAILVKLQFNERGFRMPSVLNKRLSRFHEGLHDRFPGLRSKFGLWIITALTLLICSSNALAVGISGG